MALTIQKPEEIYFAGNPILIHASSDRSKALLKIGLTIDVILYASTPSSPSWVGRSYLSLPSPGPGVAVDFDLKTVAEMALTNDKFSPLIDAGIKQGNILFMKMALFESYVENGVQIPASIPSYDDLSVPDNYKFSFHLVPGGLRDVERYTLPAGWTTKTFLGESRFFTRKPAGELVPKDSLYVVSGYFESTMECGVENGTFNVSLGGINSICTSVGTIGAHKAISRNAISKEVKSIGPQFYVVEANPLNTYQFQFINHLGVPESISCYSRQSLQYKMESEENTLIVERSFSSINSSFASKSDPVATYGLSSGYINEEWADWFVNEFLTTERAHMKVNGIFLPVMILPDSKTKLYDRSKDNLIHIDFEVKLSFNGSANNLFISNK